MNARLWRHLWHYHVIGSNYCTISLFIKEYYMSKKYRERPTGQKGALFQNSDNTTRPVSGSLFMKILYGNSTRSFSLSQFPRKRLSSEKVRVKQWSAHWSTSKLNLQYLESMDKATIGSYYRDSITPYGNLDTFSGVGHLKQCFY